MANSHVLKVLKFKLYYIQNVSMNNKEPSLQTLLGHAYLEIRRLYFLSQFPILEYISEAYLCELVKFSSKCVTFLSMMKKQFILYKTYLASAYEEFIPR